MGAAVMMFSLIAAFICAAFLLSGGFGSLIAYIVLKRRGTRLFRRFAVIPAVTLALGAIVLIYPIYWMTVIRAGNAEYDFTAPDVAAYYDEDYNITIGGIRYVEFGDLSSPSSLSGAPIASLQDPDYAPGLMEAIFGDASNAPLYTVSSETGCDIITDGYYLYCDKSQLHKARLYYDDLTNYVCHLAGEEEWYTLEATELPVVQIDGAQLSSLGAQLSGTVLELRNETGAQQIVYLIAVSRDGAAKKNLEFLKQEGQLFLVHTDMTEHNDTTYVCYRLPEELNTYLLGILY